MKKMLLSLLLVISTMAIPMVANAEVSTPEEIKARTIRSGTTPEGNAIYRIENGTVLFYDIDGKMMFEGSLNGDHEGSYCNDGTADIPELVKCEEYMVKHFHSYDLIEVKDCDGEKAIAVTVSDNEKYRIFF